MKGYAINFRWAVSDFACAEIPNRSIALAAYFASTEGAELAVLVLIDESGDPGFKRGSTSHFILAMVIFDDFTEATRAAKCIVATRDRLRVKPEFKFAKVADCCKDGFFEAVRPFNFRVRALVIDKSKIWSCNLKESKESFYSFFVKLLMKHDNGILSGAKIKIDGSGDREFKRELNAYLRRSLSNQKVTSVKFVDSDSDSLIQLADMVVGAIARSYKTDRRDANRWKAMLAGKIDDIWDFE